MVDTGQRHSPFSVVVRGEVVCMPDAWGNRFPVSETLVELRTTDQNYISTFGKPLFAHEFTDGGGLFTIVSSNHPAIVADRTLSLELTNTQTLAGHKPHVNFGIIQPERILGGLDYDVGKIQTPWAPEPPLIAGLNGKKFKYPADFSRSLAAAAGPFQSLNSLELLRSFGGQPNPDSDIDGLFATLEKESNGGNAGMTSKLATAMVSVLRLNLLKVRYSTDVFRMALQHYSNTRFNTLEITDFKSFQVGAAVQMAFGGSHPSFFGFDGRAAFCALIFVAAGVALGKKVRSLFRDVGDSHVTTVTVS